MQVIATAGHVDHGKSTLVRALTGQDPDRLAEERRRGLTIELGYCWTTLRRAGEVAFVDVPGHARFISTMLSGVGPVPATLFVVAADDSWMPQAAEHLAALTAFGVAHGVVAVTRSDLADPLPMVAEVRTRLRGTSLAGSDVVAVSARDGKGLGDLRAALDRMTAALPTPSSDSAVRLWVDRSFAVAGAGTVVTGTLPAGRIRVGDELAHGSTRVRVRGMEALGRAVEEVTGTCRVALRLGGGVSDAVRRGIALVTPDRWLETSVVDARVLGSGAVPERPLVHVGSAALSTWFRPLGDDLGRLTLECEVPLHVGDRLVLRDPGSRALWGAVVLDPMPPRLERRGAARRRAESLAGSTGDGTLADELRRRQVARASELALIGITIDDPDVRAVSVEAADWLLDAAQVPRLRQALSALVEERRRSSPLDPGLPLAMAATALDLPAPELVAAIVEPPLAVVAGRVVDRPQGLPEPLLTALEELETQLRRAPFAAPEAPRLAELGLDRTALAAAEKAGRLLRLADGIVLLPDAVQKAATALADLPQPFTAGQARVRLGTSRRVVLPLLAVLDAKRLTRRLPDDRRELVVPPRPTAFPSPASSPGFAG